MATEKTMSMVETLKAARGVLASTEAALAESEAQAIVLAGVRDVIAARQRRATEGWASEQRAGATGETAIVAIARRVGATLTRAERECQGQATQTAHLRRSVAELSLLVAQLEEEAKRQRQDDAALAAQEARKVPLVRTKRDIAEIAADLVAARARLVLAEDALAALPPQLDAARQRRERAQVNLDETLAASGDLRRELARSRSVITNAEPDPSLDRRRREADTALAEARERHQGAHAPVVQLEVRQSQLTTRASGLRQAIATLEAEHESARLRDERQPGWLAGLARRVGWAG